MSMPAEGTQEYIDLVAETGGGAALPGFNYDGHIAATRNPDGTPKVIETIPQQTTNVNTDPVVNGPTATPTNTSSFTPYLTNPPAKMPSPGTVEYEQLLKETGGASANPGFSYDGHIQATRGNSATWILNPEIPRPIEIDLSALISETKGKGDAIIGTESQDLIGASKGALRLTGGEGADKFVFSERDSFGTKGADTITDFNAEGGDKIIVSPDALPGLIENPVFESVRSKKALKSAQKSGSDLIYYKPLGQLFFDQNGSRKGFGKGGLFAVIAGAPTLSADDLGVL